MKHNSLGTFGLECLRCQSDRWNCRFVQIGCAAADLSYFHVESDARRNCLFRKRLGDLGWSASGIGTIFADYLTSRILASVNVLSRSEHGAVAETSALRTNASVPFNDTFHLTFQCVLCALQER